MVLVEPPGGWPPPTAGDTAASPPPLDHVSTAPVLLELEPAEASLGWWARHRWIIATATGLGLMTALLVFWLTRFLPAAIPSDTLAGADPPMPAVAKAVRPDASDNPAMNATEPDAGKPASPNPESAPKSKPVEKDPPVTETATPPAAADPKDAKPAESSSRKSRPRRLRPRRRSRPRPTPLAPPARRPANRPTTSATKRPKRLPPVQVDVSARLNDVIPQIELTDMPLAKAVDLLAAMGAMPVTLDARRDDAAWRHAARSDLTAS